MQKMKRKGNNKACENRHASFIPLMTTVNAILGKEFKSLIKELWQKDCLILFFIKRFRHDQCYLDGYTIQR